MFVSTIIYHQVAAKSSISSNCFWQTLSRKRHFALCKLWVRLDKDNLACRALRGTTRQAHPQQSSADTPWEELQPCSTLSGECWPTGLHCNGSCWLLRLLRSSKKRVREQDKIKCSKAYCSDWDSVVLLNKCSQDCWKDLIHFKFLKKNWFWQLLQLAHCSVGERIWGALSSAIFTDLILLDFYCLALHLKGRPTASLNGQSPQLGWVLGVVAFCTAYRANREGLTHRRGSTVLLSHHQWLMCASLTDWLPGDGSHQNPAIPAPSSWTSTL